MTHTPRRAVYTAGHVSTHCSEEDDIKVRETGGEVNREWQENFLEE